MSYDASIVFASRSLATRLYTCYGGMFEVLSAIQDRAAEEQLPQACGAAGQCIEEILAIRNRLRSAIDILDRFAANPLSTSEEEYGEFFELFFPFSECVSEGLEMLVQKVSSAL